MFEKEKQLESQIEQEDIKTLKLALQVETLDRNVDELLSHANVCPQKLTDFVNKKENFSEASWLELSKHKKILDEKLKRELENIRNPKKNKDAYSDLHVARHWLHVR